MRKAFIVEFVGIAGVGKTELSGRIGRILQERGVVCHPSKLHPWIKMRVVFSGGLLHSMLGVFVIVQIKSMPFHQLFKSCGQWLKMQGKVWGHGHIHGINLLEHGIFQTLRSIKQESQMSDMSVLDEKLLNHVPQPNLVVIVEASAETILDRRLGRKNKIGSSSLSNMIKNISRFEDDKFDVRKIAKRIDNMDVMSVSNDKDDDPEAVAILISNMIEKCVQKTDTKFMC